MTEEIACGISWVCSGSLTYEKKKTSYNQVFIFTSLGSGISEIIKINDSMPSMMKLLSSSEIYLPVVGFIFLVFLTIFLKKIFYKN